MPRPYQTKKGAEEPSSGGLLRAEAVEQEICLPSWEQLSKEATQETYGLKMPNTTVYWVPLLNPKNRKVEWSDMVDIFQRMYHDVEVDTNGAIHFTIYRPEPQEIILKKKILGSFQQAWVHESYTPKRKLNKAARDWNPPEGFPHGEEVLPIQPKSYERIEWLGDGIIQSTVANYLAWRFPDSDEGFLTKSRSKLVRTGCLGNCARFLGFSRLLILSRYHDEWLHSREDLRLLEDSFEAFIGCLFQATMVEHQYLVVMDVIFRLLERLVDIPVLLNTDENYKDLLMQYYHKAHNGAFPTYSEQGMEEVGGTRLTKMAVHDPWGAILATAHGHSKKEAEQNAAKLACIHYNVEFFSGGQGFYLEPATVE